MQRITNNYPLSVTAMSLHTDTDQDKRGLNGERGVISKDRPCRISQLSNLQLQTQQEIMSLKEIMPPEVKVMLGISNGKIDLSNVKIDKRNKELKFKWKLELPEYEIKEYLVVRERCKKKHLHFSQEEYYEKHIKEQYKISRSTFSDRVSEYELKERLSIFERNLDSTGNDPELQKCSALIDIVMHQADKITNYGRHVGLNLSYSNGYVSRLIKEL